MTKSVQEEGLQNPHLDGKPFFWEAGSTGVLLLHGLTATPAEVRLLAQDLHEAGHTVMAPLLPGHGTRPEELNEVRWRDWAWEVEQAYHLLATHCDRVFVGGESTGGVLALHLATNYADIAGLLCYAPAIQLALPMSELVRLYVAAPLMEAIPKENVGGNPYWQGYKVNPLWAVVELVRLGREVRRHLQQIRQPVLVIQGRHDATVDPAAGQIILEGVSSKIKELHWMEESGHIILLEEERDKITRLTLDFMNKV
ncbi:MAG: alpha/beta fold hydrolase [Chloroflexota bacterium]|jgi:carboxylesterase